MLWLGRREKLGNYHNLGMQEGYCIDQVEESKVSWL